MTESRHRGFKLMKSAILVLTHDASSGDYG
jgi:hypothetical protein